MTKAESSRLKHVRDAWMDVSLIASIRLELGTTQKRGQVFVHENVLQARDDQTTSALKNVFVAPCRIHLLDAISKFVVPAEEENGKR